MDAGFRELLAEFMLEADERVDAVESIALALSNRPREARDDDLAQVKRELHTLKGNAGMMGFGDLQAIAHELEDRVETIDLDAPDVDPVLAGLDGLRTRLASIEAPGSEEHATADEVPPTPTASGEETPGEGEVEPGAMAFLTAGGDRSVRVPFRKIDHLVELLAETLIFRNRLGESIRQARHVVYRDGMSADAHGALEMVEDTQQTLEKTLDLLQGHITELGMVPLSILFRSLRRIVHDESRSVDKDVVLDIEGGDTPIDKTLLEAAAEALGHLVRNAVIHGIEAPGERQRQGKNAQGRIVLSAAVEGSEVRIEVRDDGAGIDLDALRRRAPRIADDAWQPETDEEENGLLQLMFEEGVSTHDGADLSAGRGVGLSAVKRGIEERGGSIDVQTLKGVGSIFSLRLPVTASIVRSLLIEVDGETYALALAPVVETLRFDPDSRHVVNHAGVLRWRERLVPLLDLGLVFETASRPKTEGYAVLIDAGGRLRGLAVDDIAGIRDIVVKGLDALVGRPTGISGSTILGDGRVIMILDPASLVTLPPFVEPVR